MGFYVCKMLRSNPNTAPRWREEGFQRWLPGQKRKNYFCMCQAHKTWVGIILLNSGKSEQVKRSGKALVESLMRTHGSFLYMSSAQNRSRNILLNYIERKQGPYGNTWRTSETQTLRWTLMGIWSFTNMYLYAWWLSCLPLIFLYQHVTIAQGGVLPNIRAEGQVNPSYMPLITHTNYKLLEETTILKSGSLRLSPM